MRFVSFEYVFALFDTKFSLSNIQNMEGDIERKKEQTDNVLYKEPTTTNKKRTSRYQISEYSNLTEISFYNRIFCERNICIGFLWLFIFVLV